jgi:hypothetical protein
VVATPTPPVVVPPPPPPPAARDFWADDLPFYNPGNGNRVPPSGPSIRQGGGWVWQRDAVWMGGKRYKHGLTVHAPATTTVDLNRECRSFDATAGLDDLALPGGRAVFSVRTGDGGTLWTSGEIGPGDAPVAVHVPLAGVTSVRLVVTAVRGPWSGMAVADWAGARFSCV